MPTTTPIPQRAAAEERQPILAAERDITPSLNLVSATQAEKQSLTDIKYALSHALQSSLDLRDTLANFFELSQKVVQIDGISYQGAESSPAIKLGLQPAHQANYRLSAAEQALGKMCFYRAKRFTESELRTIETLIGILVFPLRNALLYREALESSLRDPLTGVGNRKAMNEHLAHELGLAERYKQAFSCLMLDLDHFKKINDTQGHEAGDDALKYVACCLETMVRKTDHVFRFGGEEFIVALSKTSHEGALCIAERIRSAVASSDGRASPVTTSIGVATYRNGDTEKTFLSRLDAALYDAKASGRNCVASAEKRDDAASSDCRTEQAQ